MRIEAGARSVVLPGQSIYEEVLVPRHDVGSRLALGDGRVFHYCKFGGTLAAGKLCISAEHTANHHNMAIPAAVAAGSRTVTVTLGATAVTADMYKGGLLGVIAGTGLGQSYRIGSHAAAALSTSFAVPIEQDLVVALALADSKVDLIPNPFNGVTQSVVEENLHIGVPMIVGTSGYYGWLQTWGLCPVLNDGTAETSGALLFAGDTVGEVKILSGYLYDIIGVAYGATHATGEYNWVALRLWP